MGGGGARSKAEDEYEGVSRGEGRGDWAGKIG